MCLRLEPLLLSFGATEVLVGHHRCFGCGGRVEMVVSRCGLETRPQTRIEPLFSLLMGPTVVVMAVVVDLVMVDMSGCGRTLRTSSK
jgi:hypothetical protein